MEITEAFRILKLDIDSNKETIDSKYKELSQKHHPDKGGSNEKMSELNAARELAIEFASNKSLIKVIREISKADSLELQRASTIEKEIEVTYKRAQRRISNRLKKMKDLTGYIGLMSGVLTILTSKVVPIIKLPDSSILSPILLATSILLGIYFLLFTHRIKLLEDTVSEFKENLDDKEEFHHLLSSIFRHQIGKEVTKEELYNLLTEWSDGRNTDRPQIRPSEILLSSNLSPKRICRLIGVKDFAKMILLKAEQSKFIDIIENRKDNGEFVTKYIMK